LSPVPGSAGEALNSAYLECFGTKRVKIALAHKLLHHKRPHLFPLVDRRTHPRLIDAAKGRHDVGYWSVVHEELVGNRDTFETLERTFECLVDGEADVSLTRLRLHDILLWLIATKRWERAIVEGRATVEWQRYSSSTMQPMDPAENA